MLRARWPSGASLLTSSALTVLCYLTVIALLRELAITF